MKKIKSIVLILLSLVMVTSALTVGVGASSAYQTYTYSIDGMSLYSPDAYNATDSIDYLDMGMTKNFSSELADIATDSENNVYISDKGNNRVVVLDRNYQYQFEIDEFVNSQGNNDAISEPQGLFITDTHIWICDSAKSRIVCFDKDGNFVKILDAPENQLLSNNASFKPIAMCIDQYERMYIVDESSYQGILVMDSNGGFVGYIGAQAVTISAWDIIWRRFQSDEQKKVSAQYTSVGFDNVTISSDGFIYAVTTRITESKVSSAINGKSKNGDFLPVKLLNPAGDEIMRRNGFWPPAGEVNFNFGTSVETSGVSKLIDVAQGPEKTWSVIDAKRNKIYTYDFNGNLLFAFGDSGEMLGSIKGIQAIAYQGDTMLILDKSSKAITVYKRTEYGNMLMEAIAAENSLDYNYAIECWEKVLQRNSNFDTAYVGIANAMYRSGNYEDALHYYEVAYNTEDWSEAYKEVRKEWMSKWILLMVAAIVILIILVAKFFGFAAKVNKRVATDGKVRKTFWQELLYGFYVIFHPFDGFYDLKHENRGSVRAGVVFVGLTVLAFFYQGIGQGYVLNPTGAYATIGGQMISVLVPFFLFIVANWCLTTLMEGEGSFKNIFIAASYSLLPLILFLIPTTIASSWVTSSEAAIVEFIVVFAFIWVGVLLYFGTQVTHDYSMSKNFITIIGTIIAMAFIVFIVLLFSTLLTKLVGLVTNIVTELQYRA